MRTFLFSLFLALLVTSLTPFPAFTSGLFLTPSFQEVSVIATESSNPFIATMSQQKETTAFVTYRNQNEYPLTLDFNLTSITATDLYGRFQFNAPLPQTIHDVVPSDQKAQINPQSLSLEPGETATVSVTFSPTQLRPGTNAFLLLAKLLPPNQTGSGQSTTSISQSLGAGIIVNAYGGSTSKLLLTKLEWSSFPIRFSLPDFLTLTLKNQGTLRAIPRGVASNTDLFGRELNRGALNEASTVILPNAQRVIYATLSPVKPSWPLMLIHLQINGYDSEHQTQFSLSKTFLYVNPWFLPGAIIVSLLFWYIKKKFSKS